MTDDIIATVRRDDWMKLQSMAGDKGMDIKEVAGMVLHEALSGVDTLGRRNRQYGEVGSKEISIVLGHRQKSSWKSQVVGVFTDRAAAELFLDAQVEMEKVRTEWPDDRMEYWVIGLPVNSANLRWWSVRYQWEHAPGYSVLEVPKYQINMPYKLEFFENGVSVMVVAENEEEALKRGRSLIRSQF